MLTEAEILEKIRLGENSYIEFKEDLVNNRKIAVELVALSNAKGGYLFLGISDCGDVVGLTRDDNEGRIMNICTDVVKPRIVSVYYEIAVGGKKIGVVEIDVGINKPYYLEKNGRSVYYMRYGSQSKQVRSRDELQRLFQASKNIHYETIPVAKKSIESLLDIRYIEEFFEKYRMIKIKEIEELERFLINFNLATQLDELCVPTIAGILLFGRNELVSSYLPQSKIELMIIRGKRLEDDVRFSKRYRMKLFENVESIFDDIVQEIVEREDLIIKLERKRIYSLHPDVVREFLVNAVIHRDYTIAGRGVRVVIFDDRLEVWSPGRLPNTISIESMKNGMRYHRNPVLLEFFVDRGLMEGYGRGVLLSLKKLREEGYREPNFLEDDDEFKVVLIKNCNTIC